MEITVTKHNDITILSLDGRLDTLSSTPFDKKLQDLISKDENKIIIDFSQLDFISSSGLRVLLTAGKQLKSVKGKLILCTVKDHVKEVFDVAGFTMLFSMLPSQDEAIRDLQ